MTRTFKTNLRCSACEEKIRPAFDAEPAIDRWSVDLADPDKPLTVEGGVSPNRVAQLLDDAGYRSLGEIESAVRTPALESAEKTDYSPLVLIVAYILGVTLLVETSAGSFQVERAMANFMAGFFLVFSFFKFLNLSAFADAYSTYDLIAARSRTYALAYPFLELALGVAYLVRFQPVVTNLATLFLMTIGTVGVVRSLVSGNRIQCACLGTVFKLPMSAVTLIEDLSMAVMAAAMLAM
jgi:hypothetical protein